MQIFKDRKEKEFFYKGTSYLMDYPEVFNSSNVKKILNLLDNDSSLFNIFYEKLEHNQFVVRIGLENNNSVMENVSLIASGIKSRNRLVGSIGIIGPKRINYNKAVASVCCVANNISNYLDS